MQPSQQQNLIIQENANSVIIAAPGSGKTFVISNKIKNNLATLREHEGVIAISYTNKASVELKNRSLSNGLNPFSSFFGTIDKFNLSEIIIPFGKQVFGIPKKEISVDKISSLTDEEKKELEWFSRMVKYEDVSGSQLDTLKDFFLNGIILIETIGILGNIIFDKSNSCRNYLKARYRSIYIDEYQDSGHEQHELFLKIIDLGITGVAVGDLNQSIYEFSGKDARFLKELTEKDGFRHFELNKNHRCDQAIINYSNYLLNPNSKITPVEVKPIFLHCVNGATVEIAKYIDDNIENVKNIFGIEQNNKIGILTRFTRTAEIIDRSLQTPHLYSETNELDKNLNVWSSIFSELLHFTFNSSRSFFEVIESFTSYDKVSDLKLLMHRKKCIEEVRPEPLSDKEGLIAIYIEIAKQIAPNSNNQESVELLKMVLNNPINLKGYQPVDKQQVHIMTLHKSKGLEFDVVFHLDLHKWAFPSSRPGANNDFKNPTYNSWQQDLNLHYVGITRAKKGCFLVTSTKRETNNGEKKGECSEFLFLNKISDLRYKP